MLKRFYPNGVFSWEYAWSEVWNVFKYGVVGFSSLAINAAVYALLSRILWVSGDRTLESIISGVIATIYNFTMHRKWTFQTRGYNSKMAIRYIMVVVIGNAFQGGLFYVGHAVFKFYDFVVLVGSTLIVALVSYVTHRWYTFHPRFEKTISTSTE